MVTRDDNIYGQLVPFFNFLQAVDVEARDSVFSSLVTGPLTSPFDSSMVVSVSLPVVVDYNGNKSTLVRY